MPRTVQGSAFVREEREKEIPVPFEQGFVHYIISYFIKYMHSRKAGFFFSGALGNAIRKPEILGYNKILRCNKNQTLKASSSTTFYTPIVKRNCNFAFIKH